MTHAIQPQPILAVVASWPASLWQRLEVAEGEKGLRIMIGPANALRRSKNNCPAAIAGSWRGVLSRGAPRAPEIAYYLSNAPAETNLLTLAQVASTRYTVEQCIEKAKGETGLDQYEVRYWHS